VFHWTKVQVLQIISIFFDLKQQFKTDFVTLTCRRPSNERYCKNTVPQICDFNSIRVSWLDETNAREEEKMLHYAHSIGYEHVVGACHPTKPVVEARPVCSRSRTYSTIKHAGTGKRDFTAQSSQNAEAALHIQKIHRAN
jgi:hypothetical protein